MPYDNYKIILDIPAENPGLGFDSYAEAFRGIIENSPPRFSIGIFGGWGTGKSTLMDKIRGQLDTSKCISVPFSAWRYEKEEHLIIPLLDSIRASVLTWSEKNANQGFSSAAQKLAKTIGGVTKAMLSGFSLKIAAVPKFLEASFDANKAISSYQNAAQNQTEANTPRSFYFASFESLKTCFKEFYETTAEARIVIFVDDLDRCLPEGALEVLESMKLFFDFTGFIFVVGLDQQVVEWCIDTRYSDRNPSEGEEGYRVKGADYIKKIFQVPFALPPIGQQQAQEIINVITSDVDLGLEQRNDLANNVQPHLEALLSGGNVNLRDVKRFLNSYTLIMKVHSGLQPDVVLSLQTVAFHPDWRNMFEALRVYGNELTSELYNLVQGNNHAISEIAPELGTIPLSFERYIGVGSPGYSLLTNGDLAQYINLATSATASDLETSSSEDFAYLELLRTIAACRRLLSTATNEANLSDALNHLRESESLVQSMEKHTEMLRSSRGGDKIFGEIQNFMRSFRSTIQSLDTNNPDDSLTFEKVNEAIARLTELLSTVAEQVRQAKRYGIVSSF